LEHERLAVHLELVRTPNAETQCSFKAELIVLFTVKTKVARRHIVKFVLKADSSRKASAHVSADSSVLDTFDRWFVRQSFNLHFGAFLVVNNERHLHAMSPLLLLHHVTSAGGTFDLFKQSTANQSSLV
jgi:hypothetical protein